VASGSSDRTLRLWGPDNGQELATLIHPDDVLACAFSADSALLVSGTNDGAVIVWDVDTERQIARTEGGGSKTNACAFISNGREVLSLSGATLLEDPNPTVLRVWSVAGGAMTVLRTLHLGRLDPVSACAFSPDGRQVALANYPSERARSLRVLDTQSGRELARFDHYGEVINCAYSPDGQRIASVTMRENEIYLWNSGTRGVSSFPEQKLSGHEGTAHKCAFSRDGRWIVSASADNTIRVWDSDTGVQGAIITGIDGSVAACAFSHDGRRVLFSTDKDIKVWEWRQGEELNVAGAEKQTVGSFASGARRLISTGRYEVNVYDTASGREIATLKQGSTVDACGFSPDGRRIASVSCFLSRIYLWDADTGQLIASVVAQMPVAFAADSRWLIVSDREGNSAVWNAETGEEGSQDEASAACRAARARAIAREDSRNAPRNKWHSPDGRFLVSVDSSSTSLRVQETPAQRDADQRLIARLAGLPPCEVLLNDCYLVSIGRIDSIEWLGNAPFWNDVIRKDALKVWDTTTWQEAAVFYAESPLEVETLRASGQFLAASDQAGRVYILELVGFQAKPRLVTLVRERGKQNARIIARCKSCGKEFPPPAGVLEAIDDLTAGARRAALEALGRRKLSRVVNRIKRFLEDPGHGSRNILADEAWVDSRLEARCPHCYEPLRFNPFTIDERDQRYAWLR
jgi:WD40 repeat protein